MTTDAWAAQLDQAHARLNSARACTLVLLAVHAAPGATSGKIVELTGVTLDEARRALRALLREGFVTRARSDPRTAKGRRPYLYFATPPPSVAASARARLEARRGVTPPTDIRTEVVA